MWCPWHVKDNTMNEGADWRRLLFFLFIMIHILTVWVHPAEMVTGLGGATLLLHVALCIAPMAEVVTVLLLQTAGWHPGGDT